MDYAYSSAQSIALRQIENIINQFRVGNSLTAGRSGGSCFGEEAVSLFADGSEAIEAIEYVARVIYERQLAG